MRTLTNILAAIYQRAHSLGVRGVPRAIGPLFYLVMHHRLRLLRARSSADATTRSSEPAVTATADRVRIAGVTWFVPADDRKAGSLSDRLLHHELPLMEILSTRQFARGGVMIDIGANIGTTAIPRLLLGDVDRVYGVEPDPNNYACLCRTIGENGLADRVIVDRVALGATDADADLLVATRLGRHRLLPAGVTKRSTIRVPTLRLDTWSSRLGADLARLRYVKCDTQGWEAHVVAGGPQLLSRPAVVWEMEVCPPLLEAAGSSLDDLCASLTRYFRWFVDLRTDRQLTRRPIEALAADVREAIAGPRNYTNVILGH
jgi:FkbM family methyltransferase